MQPVFSTPTIDPATLDETRREALIDRLYDVQRDVFEGVSREQLARYVVNSTAERTALRVYSDQVGRPVGYLAIHYFERPLGDATALVIRAEAGFRREYRGRSCAHLFGFRHMVRRALRWRKGPVYLLSCPVHPAMYMVLARVARSIYPHWSRPTPSALERLLAQLADEFGLDAVAGADPWVRQVGWTTRESSRERAHWRRHPSPAVRYYLARNPGYGEGRGMLTLVPGTLSNILGALPRLLARPLLRRLRRVGARLPRGLVPIAA